MSVLGWCGGIRDPPAFAQMADGYVNEGLDGTVRQLTPLRKALKLSKQTAVRSNSNRCSQEVPNLSGDSAASIH